MISYQEKVRSWQYPLETMTKPDYANNIVLFKNIPAHDESLLHSFGQTAERSDLYINASKTYFMKLKQE